MVLVVCYGVVGLLLVIDEFGKFILVGCIVIGFSNEEEEVNGIMNEVLFLVEDVLKEKGVDY